MAEPRGAMNMTFPKPGKVLRAVLWLIASLAIFWAIVVQWVPGGMAWFGTLVFNPGLFLHGQVWRIFTAGLLSPPGGPGAVSHLVFTLIGLYFLSPDLEKRCGGLRFGLFLMGCLVMGFVLALIADRLPFGGELLHPSVMYGTYAAMTGTAVAWARENAALEVRLFFVIPVKGSQLLWLTIGWCVLALILGDSSTEGVIAPFGGVMTGVLFGGSPSPIRAAYLQWKLRSLRGRAGGMTAASMLEPRVVKRKPGGVPLRVVQGGLDDDPPKREPPRDKRYLN